MSEATSPLSVHQAIAAVMADLPNIGKGEKSPEGYQYRGIETITRNLQPLLARHGVVIAPSARITDVRPCVAMKEGWQDVYMSVGWQITGPDGSTLSATTTGIGRDKSDKGANKAQTQAYKYLLLHLLCIADGKDDSDSHTYEDDRVEQPTAAQLESAAKSLGWACRQDQGNVFRVLVESTKTHNLDDVKAWVKANGITMNSLSSVQADEWNSKLPGEEPPEPATGELALEPDVPHDDNGEPL